MGAHGTDKAFDGDAADFRFDRNDGVDVNGRSRGHSGDAIPILSRSTRTIRLDRAK
jgi:hypothetical protein